MDYRTGIKLLPCPFCGNTSPVIRSNGIGDYYVFCDDSGDDRYGCGASSSDRSCETMSGAAARWNTRDDTNLRQAVAEKDAGITRLRHLLVDTFGPVVSRCTTYQIKHGLDKYHPSHAALVSRLSTEVRYKDNAAETEGANHD